MAIVDMSLFLESCSVLEFRFFSSFFVGVSFSSLINTKIYKAEGKIEIADTAQYLYFALKGERRGKT